MNIKRLGICDYEDIWQKMSAFTDARDTVTEDELWSLQHHPVYTLGKNGKPEHIIDAGDIPVVNSDRGGQVTYHGPGQLIVYTLIDLQRHRTGVRELVDLLELSVIDTLSELGIESRSRTDAPGVYVGDAKIAALGLRVRRGRSFHGLSLNVDMDLEPFSRINPCGYEGMDVIQLRDLIPDIGLRDIEQRLLDALIRHLGRDEPL